MSPGASGRGDAAAPSAPSPRDAFLYWLKLGFVSFGGPAGQIAIMHRDLVVTRRWISEQRFLHALNYCMVLPGPEAQQLATYIGWLLHRTTGGIVAGALFVLPSLFVLIALSWVYMAFGTVPVIAGLLYGIKPAVVAIVAHAAWRIGARTLHHPALWCIAAAAFVAIAMFAVPFPLIVLTAGVLGAVGGRVTPAAFSTGSPHAATRTPHAPAVIDDDTPAPAHAAFAWRSLAVVVATGVALWALAFVALVALSGRDGTLAAMAGFFSRAALVTFGGAYAVLPYVVQAAVEKYGWLSAAQMIDGLALGESTPGPLIMVVAFVGFVGGWMKAALGPDALALAGIAGAAVATLFTFLPSFVFILAGAPLVEATHGRLAFTAPLTGITAAVVGVICNLAVFFAAHVFWPHGSGAWRAPDPVAILLACLAAAVLFRNRAGVIPVIGGCGIAGALAYLAGFAPA